jgi:transposase
MLLDQIDDLAARIDIVTGLLDEAIAAVPAASATTVDVATGELVTATLSYPTAVERICAVPGGGPDTARAVIGEIGLDMAVFGTAPRLCSWAKVSPRTVQSGRKTGKGATGKGNPYLKAALGQMATVAAKSDTFLGERYRRLAKRMPKAKALAAIERSILVVIFHLLADPAASFEDLGADYYEKRVDKQRRTRSLVHQLEALGHQVTLTAAA